MRKNVLITGASSGIGAAFARTAAVNGSDVILVARRRNKLEKLAKEIEEQFDVRAHIIESDLTTPGEPERVWQQAISVVDSVDVLINNAGFGEFGEFTKADAEKNSNMIDLNCRVLTELAQIAAVAMSKQDSGYICNVASVAAFVPGPYMAVYHATKAYVLSLSQAIGSELKDKNVIVSALCPGATRTEFEDNASLKGQGIFGQGKELPTAEMVANYGWDSLLSGKAIAVHGFGNKVVTAFSRILPREFIVRTAARIQKRAL